MHRLIEQRRLTFLLTGSAHASCVRRRQLAGRQARTKFLHPLTFHELGDQFDLFRAVARVVAVDLFFPMIHEQIYRRTLDRICSKRSWRKGDPEYSAFSRFLRVAALCNGTIVNFTNVANDAQVARTTVYEYFEI